MFHELAFEDKDTQNSYFIGFRFHISFIRHTEQLFIGFRFHITFISHDSYMINFYGTNYYKCAPPFYICIALCHIWNCRST